MSVLPKLFDTRSTTATENKNRGLPAIYGSSPISPTELNGSRSESMIQPSTGPKHHTHYNASSLSRTRLSTASSDKITANHRRLHSRGQDAVRAHLENTYSGTGRAVSRRRKRSLTYPNVDHSYDTATAADLRYIVPKPIRGSLKLPSISSNSDYDDWLQSTTESQEDAIIRIMLERASVQQSSNSANSATPERYSARSRIPPRTGTRRQLRDLLESGSSGKVDLARETPRSHTPSVRNNKTAHELRPLLDKSSHTTSINDGIGVRWTKAELHKRRQKLGWCERHPLGHEDCPRCLMRKLRPRTMKAMRTGGGFVCLGENDELNFDGHGSWRLQEDGSYLLPDGSRILPDGTRILPDGRRVLADGTIVDENGNVVGYMDPNGNIIDGKRQADGSLLLSDGSKVLADGTRVLADGTKILPDGTKVLADGTKILADGTRVLADGTRVLADGTRILADGTRILADGTRVLADGTRVLADGTRVLADGTKVLADGTRVLADGTRVLADGTKILPDGTRVLPDGTIASSESAHSPHSDASRSAEEDEAEKARRRKKRVGADGNITKDGSNGTGRTLDAKAKKQLLGEYLNDLQTWIIEKHQGAMPSDKSEEFFDKYPHHRDAHKRYQAAVQWSKVADVVNAGSWKEVAARDSSFRKLSKANSNLFYFEDHPDTAAAKSKANDAEVVYMRSLLDALQNVTKSSHDTIKKQLNESITDFENRLRDIAPDIFKDSSVESAKSEMLKAHQELEGPLKPGKICVSTSAMAKHDRSRNRLGHHFNADLDEEQKARERRRLRDMESQGRAHKGIAEATAFVQRPGGMSALEYLAKYCILGDEQIQHYRTIFTNIDVDDDGIISRNELGFGLKTVNRGMITTKELEYVDTVLELEMENTINFRMFAVISALSEKVAGLDRFVRDLVNKMDAAAMERKMMGCKQMYYLLDEHKDGLVEMDMLVREVRAGRVTQEHENIIVAKFSEGGKVYVDFLDFLTYIPLFMEIHETINDNPLDDKREK